MAPFHVVCAAPITTVENTGLGVNALFHSAGGWRKSASCQPSGRVSSRSISSRRSDFQIGEVERAAHRLAPSTR